MSDGPNLLPASPAPPYDAGLIFLGPSTAGPNTVAVLSTAERELGLLIALLIELRKSLHEMLDKADSENRKLARALARINALERLALILATHNPDMPDTLLGRPDNRQTTALWHKAQALNDAAHAKVKDLGAEPCARAVDDVLNGRVVEAIQALSAFILHPEQTVATLLQNAPAVLQTRYAAIGARTPQQIVEAYAAETPAVPQAHQQGMDIFTSTLGKCHEELCKTEKMTDLAPLGRDAIENPGDKSLYHLAVKSAAEVQKKLEQKLGAAAGAAGAPLFSPDDLWLALLKVYGLRGILKGAVSKSAAKDASTFLVRQLLTGLRLPKSDRETLNQYYIRLTKAQSKLVQAQNAEALLASRPGVDPLRLDAKQKARVEAEGDVEIEAARVRGFFTGIHDGPWVNGALTILAACQILDAWQEMTDPDASAIAAVQNGTAALGIGVQALGTLGKVSTVLGPKIPFDKVRVYVAALDVEALVKFASIAGPVLAMVSGGFQLLDGYTKADRTNMVVGGLSVASGFCLCMGALVGEGAEGMLAAAALTGIGDLVAIGLAVFAVVQAAQEALKKASQKLVEGLLAGFDNDPSWTGKNYIDLLGLRSQLKDVATASGNVSYFDIPWTDADGSRDKLIANICDLGFDRATADAICETDSARQLRLNPPVLQPEYMN
jgi:hypothetical protein